MMDKGEKMQGIIHIRIDDRLIHGQVATRWTAETKATRILIPNDQVAVDDTQKQILRMAAPSGVNTSLITVEKAASNILAGKYASQRVLLVVKSPLDIVRLKQLGLDIKEFNVGNMAKRDNTKQIKRSISITDEEKQAFEQLINDGVKITAQMVPDENAPLIKDLI